MAKQDKTATQKRVAKQADLARRTVAEVQATQVRRLAAAERAHKAAVAQQKAGKAKRAPAKRTVAKRGPIGGPKGVQRAIRSSKKN